METSTMHKAARLNDTESLHLASDFITRKAIRAAQKEAVLNLSERTRDKHFGKLAKNWLRKILDEGGFEYNTYVHQVGWRWEIGQLPISDRSPIA